MTNDTGPPLEPIAICGVSMRLPGGVRDAHSFWDALIQKRELKCPVPDDRFNVDAFHSPHGKPGTIISRDAFYLTDAELGHLDTSVFNISPHELRHIDPQQRMLLEITRECLENAGETSWRGKKVGCYVGTFGEDWLDLGAKDTLDPSMYRAAGTSDFALSNRLSYEFDFRGPSMTIKAGCSSAMMCLNEACWAINAGQCDSAVVAGSNLILTPTMTIQMGTAALSPTGTCKTFDAEADGYARGEAVNAVFVKRLSDALQHGNAIRAVIRGIGVNSDGQTSRTLTPSLICQESLIRDTYAKARLPVDKTGFFECHGTGTPVGDPIEANAVYNIFGDAGIHIGSVKPNFGHNEGASAITSIIKSVLALEKREIPPNMRFSKPNSAINWGSGRLVVPTDVMPWPADRDERVSVNSFGIGGANGHLILDSARRWLYPSEIKRCEPSTQLLVLSASHEKSLASLKSTYEAFLSATPSHKYDLAHTLGARRLHGRYRTSCISTAQGTCTTFSPTVSVPKKSQLVFVFSGQGANWPRMGEKLLQTNTVFHETLEELDKVLTDLPQCSFSLEEELLRDKSQSRAHEAEISQPLSTAVQICLCNALASAGIRPAAVVGHSSGEIAAAYAAAALTKDEAIKAAFFRGQAIKAHETPGAMITVGFGRDFVEKLPLHGATLACDNSPSSVTLSGTREQIEAATESIEESHPHCLIRKLHVDKAYHSSHMHSTGKVYRQMLDGYIDAAQPKVPYFSTLEGRRLEDTEMLDVDYWPRHLESPVCFRSAIEQIVSEMGEGLVFAEIGPHPTLAGSLIQTCAEQNAKAVPYVSFMRRSANTDENFLEGLGRLYELGAPVDFHSLTPNGKTLTDLPNYAWHHDKRQWNETRLSREWRFRKYPRHDLLGVRTGESTSLEPSWRNVLRLDEVEWIRQHQVGADVVLPFTAYCAMAVEAVQQIHEERGAVSLRHVRVGATLTLGRGDAVEVITALRPVRLSDSADSPWREFTVSSFDGSQWIKHCTGSVRLGRDPMSGEEIPFSTSGFARKVDTESWYKSMASIGLNYGAEFQRLQSISAHTSSPAAAANVDDVRSQVDSAYELHPATIDSAVQLIAVAASRGLSRNVQCLFVPIEIEEMYMKIPGEVMAVRATAEVNVRGALSGNVTGHCAGKVALQIKGLSLYPLDGISKTRGPDPHAAAELVWAPDLDLSSLSKIFGSSQAARQKEKFLAEKLTFVCALETLDIVGERQAQHLLPREYLEWLHRWTRCPTSIHLSPLTDLSRSSRLEVIRELAKELPTSPASAAGSAAIVKTLEMIQSSGPLQIDLKTLSDFRWWIGDCDAIEETVRLAGHINPLGSVLELTWGDPRVTEKLLEALRTLHSESLCSSYTITCSSESILKSLKETFKDIGPIELAVFDMSQDPTKQGFATESYDLIVVSEDVLRTCSDMRQALKNLRRVVRSNGKLIVYASSSHILEWPLYVLGLHPDDGQRPLDSSASNVKIDTGTCIIEMMTQAGFLNVQELDNALILATLKRPSPATIPTAVALLCSDKGSQAVCTMTSLFESHGVQAYPYTLEELVQGSRESQLVVSILDHEDEPALVDMSPHTLTNMAALFQTQHQGILWLTRSCQLGACLDPGFAMILGMARTARTEFQAAVCTLELPEIDVSGAGDAIWKVLCRFVEDVKDKKTGQPHKQDLLGPDFEFAFHNGLIHIPRFQWKSLRDDILLDTKSEADKTSSQVVSLQMDRSSTVLGSLKWKAHPPRSLEKDYVEVQVKATGVNFKDVLVSLGIVNHRDNDLGIEGAGIVTVVGEDVVDLKPGDRVMFCGTGALGNSVRGPEYCCCKIPDSIGFKEAATMPCVFLTAIYALMDLGRLEKGESVLIHAGCGGVGLAAIQLAQMIGAEIFATVGSEAKVQHLMETYSIPRSHIFNSRSGAFYPELMRQTSGRGVDVVLNSLSGELLHASWRCVAKFGRMIEIGKRDFLGRGKLGMEQFEANRTYCGLALDEILEERPQVSKRLFSRLLQLLQDGSVKPISPITTFAVTEIEDCFTYMQKGQHIGKIVVEIPDDLDKLGVSNQRKGVKFYAVASYLLVGGLGGLGRAIARWMVEKGASNLIFLSPSAGTKDEDAAFLEELRAMGCVCQTIAGNVADKAAVEKVVKEASSPIQGVVQASIVLKDRLLPDMTYEEWNAVLEPKVKGTWNLHNALLESDLDFFVVLGSLSGIVGQHGQSNYNAANTFLNSFIQYRHSLALPGSIVNLSAVGDIGTLSQRTDLLRGMEAAGAHIICEHDVLEAFHWAVDNSKPWQRHSHRHSKFESTEGGGVSLGIRSSIPLRNLDDAHPWKRDRRMALYHNSSYAAAEDPAPQTRANEDTSARLIDTMQKIRKEPKKTLSDPTTAVILAEEIGKKAFSILLRDEKELDIKMSLSAVGLDSLMAMRLRQWWRDSFQVEVNVLQVANAKTFEGLGALAAEALRKKYVKEDS